jgi:hypothetical protein
VAALPAAQSRLRLPVPETRAHRDRVDAAVPAHLSGAPWPAPTSRRRCRFIASGETFEEPFRRPPDLAAPHQKTRRPTAVRTAEAVEDSIA